MSKAGQYVFVVITIHDDGKPMAHITHYCFDNIDKANAFKSEMDGDTSEHSIIITARKMKG